MVIGIGKTVCTIRDARMRQGTSCVFLYCPLVWLMERLSRAVAFESKRLEVDQAVSRSYPVSARSAKVGASGATPRFGRGISWSKADENRSSKRQASY